MINLVRIEKHLYEELSDIDGFLGQVEQIYNSGFHITAKNGDLLYFQGEKRLQSPFSLALDVDVNRWISDVSLSIGDAFSIDRERIYSLTNRYVSVSILQPIVIDRRNADAGASSDREAMGACPREIIGRLLLKGRFDGLLGVLEVLKERWPVLGFAAPEKPNLWSRSALPAVINLMKSSADHDAELFEHACDTLVGLGPGLTPSGDDLLVGFLATQYKFDSPIKRWLYDSGLIERIIRKQKEKTTSVAFQFLKCASEGLFSEILIDVIDSIIARDHSHGKKQYPVLDDFLRWGHTSGTDTMVGVVVALCALIDVEGK
jgi:hypothetical protein